MKATRDYGECEKCSKKIKEGDEFQIIGGTFYHAKCAPAAPAGDKTGPEAPQTNTPISGGEGKKKRARRKATPAPAPAPEEKPNKARKRKATPAPAEVNTPPADADPGEVSGPRLKRDKPHGQKPRPRPKARKTVYRSDSTDNPAPAPAAPAAPVSDAEKKPTVNAIIVGMLIERAYTDDEIVGEVLKNHPEQNPKKVRSYASINRCYLNTDGYKRLREANPDVDWDTPFVRMLRINGELRPAYKANVIPVPAPERKRNSLDDMVSGGEQ